MIYRMHRVPGSQPGHAGIGRACCRELLAYGLARETGLRLHDLVLVRNRWGKPALRDYPDIHFSVSHCEGLSACVLADGPVGIDVERIRPFNRSAARHAFAPEEFEAIRADWDPNRRFFIHWTLKESCVKAMGMGLAFPLREAVFRITGDRIICRRIPGYRFVLLDDGGCHVTAVCYRLEVESVTDEKGPLEDGYGRIYRVQQSTQDLYYGGGGD